MVRAMTTLKPQLVRADTLDLQDPGAPSAKDHTRQPTHPSPYGYGPAAPHQAQTLRHAQEEEYHQQKTSPRVGEDSNAGHYNNQHHHHHHHHQNNQRFYDDPDEDVEDGHSPHGLNGSQEHDRDLDNDEEVDGVDDDLDDDLMDKISSSPSIEDGKYSLPVWLSRTDALDFEATLLATSTPTRGTSPSSSSPFVTSPLHFPIPARQEEITLASHHDEIPSPPVQITHRSDWGLVNHASETSRQFAVVDVSAMDHELQEVAKYLLPLSDPALDGFSNEEDEGFCEDDSLWEDEVESIADYVSSSDDEIEDFLLTTDPRFVDSGWGGECLREAEDIDFEFVYALHTFVATVEGQANATKGDTMVLLDDSNSYWWLVRVVKDGSIGYLPAEHIETPTERLARLNKHRNIDLSASMLGDNPEKSKNPLKKAMRRRNAKTVQFAAPTYYEADEIDFSDQEEGNESQNEIVENGVGTDDTVSTQERQTTTNTIQTQPSQTATVTNGAATRLTSQDDLANEPSSPIRPQPQSVEPVQIQQQSQDAISRSRKTVGIRDTDSFFKDDNVETKKISLTPRLLRGDSDIAEPENRQRPSLDGYDRLSAAEDKPRDDKKKEKKGMLSGLFKRKEKKGVKPESERSDRVVEESVQQPQQGKDSIESLSGSERKMGKLQKPVAPSSTFVPAKPAQTESRTPQRELQPSAQTAYPAAPSAPAPIPPSSRQAEDHDEQFGHQQQDAAANVETQAQPQAQAHASVTAAASVTPEKRSIFSPITDALKPSPASEDAEQIIKPVYSKRAKERFALEASDSEDDRTPTGETQLQADRGLPPIQASQSSHGRTDSGVQISPVELPSTSRKPFSNGEGSSTDDSEHEQSESGLAAIMAQRPIDSTPIESEPTASTSKPSPSMTHTPSTSRSTPTWSDASLRSYMENDQDIKDLLIIVHDKSNITPVSADHPLMTNLFSNERVKLAEMQSQLDNMLLKWMSRKNPGLAAR